MLGTGPAAPDTGSSRMAPLSSAHLLALSNSMSRRLVEIAQSLAIAIEGGLSSGDAPTTPVSRPIQRRMRSREFLVAPAPPKSSAGTAQETSAA